VSRRAIDRRAPTRRTHEHGRTARREGATRSCTFAPVGNYGTAVAANANIGDDAGNEDDQPARVAESGNAVTGFTLEALVGPNFVPVLTGGALGPNFAAAFSTVTTTKLGLEVTSASGGMSIAELRAF
jgi:hypothetical protein